MKILLVSADANIIQKLKKPEVISENQLTVLDENTDSLDVMSYVFTYRPSMLIIDDDFLKPKSAHLLKSIKKVNKNIGIIFITSDSSVDLGREISPLGIQYYAIKPLSENELAELINSINKLQTKESF